MSEVSGRGRAWELYIYAVRRTARVKTSQSRPESVVDAQLSGWLDRAGRLYVLSSEALLSELLKAMWLAKVARCLRHYCKESND